MSLFNFFSPKKSDNDPYWIFDIESHYKPKLNKGQFCRLTGFDFGWFILEPLSKFVGSRAHELERSKSLSYGQKALYYWWYVDAQVRNGGFVQFYYNGYGEYAPVIVKGLKHVGDMQMSELVEKAHTIYLKHKQIFDNAGELFGSDLYDRLADLTALDSQYYKKNDQTMAAIEKYARQHPDEFCVDEEGKPLDLNFTGMSKFLSERNPEGRVYNAVG